MKNNSVSGSSETLSNRKNEKTSIVNALLSSALANSSSNNMNDSESVWVVVKLQEELLVQLTILLAMAIPLVSVLMIVER